MDSKGFFVGSFSCFSTGHVQEVSISIASVPNASCEEHGYSREAETGRRLRKRLSKATTC